MPRYEKIAIGMSRDQVSEILEGIQIHGRTPHGGADEYWLFYDAGIIFRQFYSVHFRDGVVVEKDYDM